MSGDSNGTGEQASLLWEHPRPKDSKMWDFMEKVNKTYEKDFSTYEQLYKWSIENIADFWGEAWEYTGIRTSAPYGQASAK